MGLISERKIMKHSTSHNNPDWWKTFKFTFGKYIGETVYSVLTNDYQYIKWIDSAQLDTKTRAAIDKAIEHYNIHFV